MGEVYDRLILSPERAQLNAECEERKTQRSKQKTKVKKTMSWVWAHTLQIISRSRFDHVVFGKDTKDRFVLIAFFLNRDEAATWVQANDLFGRRVYGGRATYAAPGLTPPGF
jgi:hypothetical protein